MEHNNFILSPSAAKEIKRLSNKQFPKTVVDSPSRISASKGLSYSNVMFRLAVKAGGCSGFYYYMSFEKANQLDQEQAIPSSECLFESEGIKMIIDSNSWKLIKGLKLDYSEDLMGGSFRFYNPLAASVCSCGNSFALSEE